MGFSLSKLGLAGWFGDKAGDALKDTEVRPTPVDEPSFYPQIREAVGNRLLDLTKSGPEKYTGEMVAPLSDRQLGSLGKLDQYANQGVPSVIGEGSAEISKTLAGGYDPETSAYYKAYRDQRLNELTQSKDRLNADAAGAGRFFHGGRIDSTRKLEEGATRDINLQSATLAENERNRKLAVLPEAMRFGSYAADLPLNQAKALQDQGSIEQRQKQAEDTAAMNEFLRQIGQGRADLNQAGGFAGDVPYAYTQYQPSETMRLLQSLISAGGDFAGKAGPAAAAAACHVAELLYGVDDLRTHLARFYVATHDSAFLRDYRAHSRAWAARLKTRPELLAALKPLWDRMVSLAGRDLHVAVS